MASWGRGPSPTRPVSLGRTDHDRREQEPPTRTKPARPAPVEVKTTKVAGGLGTPARNKTSRQGPQPDKTCKSWKNRSRSARAGATHENKTGEAGTCRG